MSDNSTADPGAGGDTFRTKDRAGIKTEIVGLDLTPAGGSETLMNGVMPVSDNSGSLTVDNAGTFAVQADTELTTSDLDTGAGTDTRAVVGIALAASGGAVLAGSANPVPISDNSGSLTVDGTVTANAGTGPFPVSDNGGSITVDAAAASFAVNSAQVSGTATSVNSGTKDAGTQRVILASDQTVVPISDNSSSLTVDAPVGTPAFVRLSDGSAAITTLPVSLAALPTLVAGTAQIGTVSLTPATTGGLSTFHLVSAATTNATNVKASAGQVFGWFIRNLRAQSEGAAGDRKVAFHNTAGSPTAGASVFFSLNIPAGGAANVFGDVGIPFSTGIAITTVTDAADAGTTAVGLSDLDINLWFK